MNAKSKPMLMLSALLVAAGCASEKSADTPAPSVTCVTAACTVIATPTPTTTVYSGSTAQLVPANSSSLQTMFYNSRPVAPTNITINIDVTRQGDAVIIGYDDGGVHHEAALGTVHPYSGYSNANYNGWVDQAGKTIWKGFFQDQYGAIVVIIDKFLSQGDGVGGNIIGGSVYFQNFNRNYPNSPTQGPLKMCWEISMGPYDCRTFLSGGNVNMTSSYYPSGKGPDQVNSYVKLGDFNGISRSSAGL